MARSILKNTRFFADGYNLSGYTRSFGPLSVEFDTDEMATLTDAVKGTLLGQPTFSVGTLNGVFDNTATSGLHVLASVIAARNVCVLIGGESAPAAGCPAFAGKFNQLAYPVEFGNVEPTGSIQFGKTPVTNLLNYIKPWGVCLQPGDSQTGANSATGVDDNGAATTAGGYLAYQILSITGSGTATISIDDSANNSTWLALSGATTGAISNTSAPTSGVVQLGTTATVRRYLRWQLSLSGSTACSFVLTFVRG